LHRHSARATKGIFGIHIASYTKALKKKTLIIAKQRFACGEANGK
jgi:hypothetical protein